MPPAEKSNLQPSGALLRIFRAEDTDAVLAIAAQSPEAAAWSCDSYRTLLQQSGSLALVTEEHGEIVGFLVGREVEQQAEILNLAVSPQHRRRGHATSLLTAALQQFESRGVQSAYLEVRQSNIAAIAFYARHGFRSAGLRKAYYRSPDEPALTMMKNLAG